MNKNNTNYRFNIAKYCAICGKSFITDIFDEEDMCSTCQSLYQVIEPEDHWYSTSNDIKDVIDGVVHVSSRTPVYRYD